MLLIDDIRFAFRLLCKTPTFTGTTLLVIVLGLTLYLVSYPMSEQMSDVPMPFPEGDRYVTLKTIDGSTGLDNGIDNLDQFTFNFLAQNTTSYSLLGAYNEANYVLSDGEFARSHVGAEISLDLIGATAVSPILGRNFTAEDFIPGAGRSILLSHSVWQNYYLADPDIVGETSRVNGQPSTVIGVMPEGFSFPFSTELWVPLVVPNAIQPGEGGRVSVMGILNREASHATAEAELNENLQRLYADYPEIYANDSGVIYPYASIMTSAVLGFPEFLRLISFLILCLAATNLSSLLFIRSRARQQELLIRASVGASGVHLAKQLLLETLILCFVGLVLSLPISAVLLQIIHGQILGSAAGLPFWYDLRLDSGALYYGILVTFTIWIASGMLIAMKAYRSEPGSLLSAGKQSSGGGQSARVTSSVVGIEMVLSFMLLIFCGVIAYSVVESTRIDFGGDTADTVLARADLTQSSYADEAQYYRFAGELQRALANIPVVGSVAVTSAPLGVSGRTGRYDLAERSLEVERQLPLQSSIWVSDNYFASIGVDILAGRDFDSSDTAESESVVILSQEFAQRLWPGESPLGKQIVAHGSDSNQSLTVVGIVPNLVQNGLFENILPNLYRPLGQDTPAFYFMLMRVDGEISLSSLESEILAAGRTVDRDTPLTAIRTLAAEIRRGQGGLDVIAGLFSGISFATLLLAAIGIFGIVARSIDMRTHEIGVRRALGSTEYQVIAKYVRQGMRYLLAGFIIGGLPAIGLLITNPNTAFQGVDVVTALWIVASIVTLTMTLLIFVASYLPARKAVGIDPGDALHYE